MAATGPAARSSCCDLPYFAALALILWLGFFPGIMNADSTSMLAQAVAGRYDDWHSPLLSFLWRQANGLIYGPASLSLLCKIVFFPAFYLFLRRLVPSPGRRMAIATAIVAVPPVTNALAAATKDGLYVAVMMAAVLAFAAALERPLLWLAFAALALAAVLVRHEAPLTLLPMIAAGLLARLPPGRPLARLGALGLAVVLSGALVPAATAIDRFLLAAADADALQTLEVLDLAGISLRLGENLMPGYIQALGVDFPTLGRRYRADSVTPLMWPADKRYLPVPPGAQARALRAAWIDGIRRCPACYLRHRARFVLALLGLGERPQDSRYRFISDTDPHGHFPSAAAMGADYPPAPLARLYDRLAAHIGPVFAGWPWLIGSAGLLAWGMRRGGRRGTIAVALAASALLGIAGLALLAADAATRYLFWPIIATLLGLVAAAAPAHDGLTPPAAAAAPAGTADRPR